MQRQPWSAWRAFVVCQVWAFALFLPVNAELTTAHNRWFMFWDLSRLPLFLGATMLLGLGLFLAGEIVRRITPDKAALAGSWLALVTLALLTWTLLIQFSFNNFQWLVMTPAAVALAAAGTWLCMKRGWNVEIVGRGLATAALYMALLLPIFWGACLTYASYPPQQYPDVASVPSRDAGQKLTPADNIYIFVFDEWSYRLTIEDGTPRPHLKSLRSFANEACLFTDAHSPGCHTLVSLPRLLFERKDMFLLQNGTPGFADGDSFQPCKELPTMFTNARDNGFRTYMVGFHHPYQAMLGEGVDYAWSQTCWPAERTTPVETFGGLWWNWGSRYLGPVLCKPFGCGQGWIENRAQLQLTHRLKEQTMAVLADERKTGQFAVFHLPFPHYPFIFHADGSLRPMQVQYPQDSPLLMRDHIAYLDRVIEEFLTELKKRGKYDNSIIVLTSDHNYRKDPDIVKTAHTLTHVPLFVRFPGQKESATIHRPFTTTHLRRLLNTASLEEHGWRKIDQLLSRGRWFDRVADSEVSLERLLSR